MQVLILSCPCPPPCPLSCNSPVLCLFLCPFNPIPQVYSVLDHCRAADSLLMVALEWETTRGSVLQFYPTQQLYPIQQFYPVRQLYPVLQFYFKSCNKAVIDLADLLKISTGFFVTFQIRTVVKIPRRSRGIFTQCESGKSQKTLQICCKSAKSITFSRYTPLIQSKTHLGQAIPALKLYWFCSFVLSKRPAHTLDTTVYSCAAAVGDS